MRKSLFFTQDEFSSSKLSTLINFPTRGLDMTSYLAQQDIARPSSSMGFNKSSLTDDGRKDEFSTRTLPLKSVHFEGDLKKSKNASIHSSKKIFIWKKSKKSKKQDSPSKEYSAEQTQTSSKGGILANRNHEYCIYDLYAICSHHGDMNRGHYTAHCLNPANSTWYTFDDHHVLPVYSEQQLVTQDAYILFYVRRSAKHRHQGTEQAVVAANGGNQEMHWIYQIPRYTLNLNSLGSVESLRFSPQRQGFTTSAQDLSTASGVSPPNADGVFFTAHPSNLPSQASTAMSALQHMPPTLPNQQHSRESSPGHISSPPSSIIYPQSLPSPIMLSPPTSLSQCAPTSTQPQAALPRRRAGSFHGTTRFSVTARLTDSHSATRVWGESYSFEYLCFVRCDLSGTSNHYFDPFWSCNYSFVSQKHVASIYTAIYILIVMNSNSCVILWCHILLYCNTGTF